MRILSVDPGAVKMGLALEVDGSLEKTALVRLIPKELNFGQFEAYYGSSSDVELTKGLLKFLEESPWRAEFLRSDLIIVESQGLKFTSSLVSSLITWLLLQNPLQRIQPVHPYAISRFFKIGGKQRPQRKKLIRELVEKRLPGLQISQDETDAVLHIFYYHESSLSKKKTQKLSCPRWSSDSTPHNKTSTSTGAQKESETSG